MSVLDGAFRIDNLSKGIKVSSHLFVAFLVNLLACHHWCSWELTMFGTERSVDK